MKKYGIALALIGLTIFITGWGTYICHKINTVTYLIVDYKYDPILSMQFGLMYSGVIIVGFIIIMISYFLLIKESNQNKKINTEKK